MRLKYRWLVIVCLLSSLSLSAIAQNGWKAGTAKINITPKENMWMAGFASRTRPSEGAMHDLWLKALALEDQNGYRSLLITGDIIGFFKNISDDIRDQIAAKHGLSRAQIILNSSHTHSGPVLDNASLDIIYPVSEAERNKIMTYTASFKGEVIALAEMAFRNLEPVTLYSGNGVTRFQVNRRNNDVSTLTKVSELKGPQDYAVPVIKIASSDNQLKAIVFGYACHPTVLNGYEWSGDYPGFTQIALEKQYPGAMAMFFQGAGGDQNALPRNTVPLAKQYGLQLAASVTRVLEEDMKILSPVLTTSYNEVDLLFAKSPDKNELKKMADTNSGYLKVWAEHMLKKVEAGATFPTTYPYPVQAWKLGDQALLSLGGELTIEYSIKLKKILGPETFIMGYSNDVMSYIPSLTILKEGGYEGNTSQMAFGLHTTWDSSIESRIIETAIKTAQQAGISVP
jgi:neutral ceramidase